MRKYKIAILIVLICIFTSMFIYANTHFAASSISNVSVFIDDMIFYVNKPLLINNTTYVPMQEYIEAVKNHKSSNIIIDAEEGRNYIIANGRYLCSKSPVIIIDGELYAPIRILTKAFCADLIWDNETKSVFVTKNTEVLLSGDEFYDYDEVYWLSRIINAQSDESFESKLIVGTVVMNRVESEGFPDDIYSVIFDKNFIPVMNNTIYDTPDEECIIAAKICLDGYRTANGILYFD